MTTDGRIKVGCARCGKTNYYPRDAGGRKVACGFCKSILAPPGAILETAADGARNLFRASSLPVLVDFFSPTCGPCLAMDPIVESLARRRAGEIVVLRINVERQPELAAPFGVQAVPTYMVIHKGVERGRVSGAMNEMDFSLWVARHA